MVFLEIYQSLLLSSPLISSFATYPMKPTNKCQKTIVIKVGTSSICDETSHFPLLSNLSGLVETVLKLKSLHHRVVVVTSAAVGTGLRRLNIAEKPAGLAARQVKEITS